MLKNSVLVSFLLMSCGPSVSPHLKKDFYIEEDFIEYVEKFEGLYGRSIGPMDIEFAELELPNIGQCEIWSYFKDKIKIIKVDYNYWHSDLASEEAKIGLIFHELGHCELERGHINDTYVTYLNGPNKDWRVPSSIMFPYNFYSDFYSELEQYYFNELFNPETRSVTDDI